jgi:hypothetical protein
MKMVLLAIAVWSLTAAVGYGKKAEKGTSLIFGKTLITSLIESQQQSVMSPFYVLTSHYLTRLRHLGHAHQAGLRGRSLGLPEV